MAWVLNLASFGCKNVLQITKVIWWLWVACIAFGIRMAVAHRGSAAPLDWLLGLYFAMYAVLGLLWHSCELHLRGLYVGAAATNTAVTVCTIPCLVLAHTATRCVAWSPDEPWAPFGSQGCISSVL